MIEVLRVRGHLWVEGVGRRRVTAGVGEGGVSARSLQGRAQGEGVVTVHSTWGKDVTLNNGFSDISFHNGFKLRPQQ